MTCVAGVNLLMNFPKDFADSGTAKGSLAIEKLLARRCVHLHTGQPGTLLTTIMLFLHQQIEFVKAITPRPVLVLIVLQGLAQAYHRHAAFVFKRFHLVYPLVLFMVCHKRHPDSLTETECRTTGLHANADHALLHAKIHIYFFSACPYARK